MVIVTAYQPVDKTDQAGKITVAAQHRSLLASQQDTLTNPRTAFRRDLTRYLTTLYERNAMLLILGDFNEELGSDPDGISSIADTFGLLDVMATRHSSTPPPTYARGVKRLDYALASPEVCEALQSTGYGEFNTHFSSDHRGYFFDLDTLAIFRTPIQQLASPTRRGFSSNNLAQVTQYIREKHRQLTAHNAFERASLLLLPRNHHSLAERLDSDLLAASLSAEQKVTRFGEPAWSLELAAARKKVSLLTKHLSSLRTGIPMRLPAYEMGRLPDPTSLPPTVLLCSQALKDAKATVQDIVSTSYQHRDQERSRRLRELDQSMDKVDRKTAIMLRRLKKAEDIKELFKKLRHVRKQDHRQGVTRIEIPEDPTQDPKTCSVWKQIDVPTEVLNHLQDRNRKHFGQAHGTPFTVMPLSNDMGFGGDGPTGDSILEGEYNFEGLQDNVKTLLAHMKRVHAISTSDVRPTITEDEYRDKLRIWSESTTTSPSGMHLGHYKALVSRHSFSTDLGEEDLSADHKNKRDELDRKQSDLRNLHLNLLNYALSRGYSYTRWQVIANTILFKDHDNVRLHRTRVIHIYGADFNLALGIKWREAMHRSEDKQVLNDGQYGSRPHRNATDPVFLEELQLEISRATRKPLVLTNYDAAACYDRIIPSVGMLVSRKFGVPDQVAKMNSATLEHAEYRIRTNMGLAKTGYRHSVSHPIYGTGQGSANSPAIWCFLSSALFDGYDSVATQATYSSANGEVHQRLGLIGFVDDCNGQTNQFPTQVTKDSIPQLLIQAKSNAQYWSDLLQASGGALELSKCSCHVVNWAFNTHGKPFLASKNTAHQDYLQVEDTLSNTKHSLQLLSPYQAHKTLGHYKDPAGTQGEQFRQLLKKSDDITKFLWTCPLTRLEAWTFYYACYLPSVCYPLACSSLTKQKLEHIQQKALSILIPRCGFNRHTKREILFGPMELGGACFRHLYVEQGIRQVGLFMRNWRAQSTAGKLLRIAVSWFQQQIGTSFSFLRNVTTPLPHLESVWLKSLREFLASIDSHLSLEETYVAPLQRVHDAHIMDCIIESKSFLPEEIIQLNLCRLYLNAQTISDLTCISGATLDMAKLRGEHSWRSSKSVRPQIHQARPAKSDWDLWIRANTLWSQGTGHLIQPLGPWLVYLPHQHQRHYAYWTDSNLWIRKKGIYSRCRAVDDDQVQFLETIHTADWHDIPPNSLPVHVEHSPPHLWTIRRTCSYFQHPKKSVFTTFDQFITASCEPWETQLLQHIEMFQDPFAVSVALENGIQGVSDGSVWIKQLGAYGWALSSHTGDRLAEGMGPAPGASPNSFRSEAYGLLAMLCFLQRLAEYTMYHETWQLGTIATDSLSLVDTIQGVQHDAQGNEIDRAARYIHQLDPLFPEWDIVVNIRRKLHLLPDLILKHVKGHQDRRIQYQNLSLLAQLNVDADRKANQFQAEHGEYRAFAPLAEGVGVHLVTPRGTITSKYASAIRHQASYGPLLKHIQERNHWPAHTPTQVNWPAHGAALRKRNKRRSHFIKFVQGILPTNHSVHRNDPARRGCPICNNKDETWMHLPRCKHLTRERWRTAFFVDLRKTSIKWKMRHSLWNILRDGLLGWLASEEPFTYQLEDAIYEEEFTRLITQQNQIGWHNIFLGRFSGEWELLQDNHYRTQPNYNSKKSPRGSRWQVAIIGTIWTQWYKVWVLRNSDVHGADSTHQAIIDRHDALRTLRRLYELKEHVEPSVRTLLMEDIRHHEVKSTWHIKNWIAINEPILRASFRRAKKKAIAGMLSIRHYFTST